MCVVHQTPSEQPFPSSARTRWRGEIKVERDDDKYEWNAHIQTRIYPTYVYLIIYDCELKLYPPLVRPMKVLWPFQVYAGMCQADRPTFAPHRYIKIMAFQQKCRRLTFEHWRIKTKSEVKSRRPSAHKFLHKIKTLRVSRSYWEYFI